MQTMRLHNWGINLNLTGKLQKLILKHPDGYGTATVNTAQPILENGTWTGRYYSDYPVTICTEPHEGRKFLCWEVTGLDGVAHTFEETEITLTLRSNMVVRAVYEGIPGDVSLDGSVTLLDAVLLQKYLVGSVSLTTEQLTNADLTQDARTNAFDLAVLKRNLVQSTM